MSRLFIFILLITSFLSAQDEYELKDGTIIKGTVVSETANETQIETESGEIIIIKVKIDRIGGVYNIELDSGKSIIGQIVFEDTKLIRLDVVGSKPVELYWENIRNITKAENEDDGTGRINDNSDQLVINSRRQEAEDCGNASDDYVDYDGNVYKTVQIGEQVWMAENLRVTHYNDGEPIQTRMSLGTSRWGGIPVGMYSDLGDFHLEDDYSEIEADAFGKNYNWYAVDSDKLAGEGWRVPSDEDWMELEAFIGMSSEELDDFGWRGTNQGAKLAGRAGLWAGMNCFNCEYTLLNDPEFSTTCLNLNPSRSTWLNDDLYPVPDDWGGDNRAHYWTSTNIGPQTTYQPVERTVDRALYRKIYFAQEGIERTWTNKYHGLQVRLIKD